MRRFLTFTFVFTLAAAASLQLAPAKLHAQEAERTYTDYNITLDEAVDIQLNEAGNPITDVYKGAPAYVNADHIEFTGPNKVQVLKANIRTEPNFEAPIAHQFIKNAPVNIVGIESGDEYKGSTLWFKIIYEGEPYYIHTDLVDTYQVKTTASTNVYAGPGEDYHAYGALEKGKKLTIASLNDTYIQISYQNWRKPTRDDIKARLKPDEKNMYQHVRLDQTIGVSADALNHVLTGHGILENQGQAFIDGGKEHSINEAYLIAHAMLETAHGTSELATGIEVGLNKKDEPSLVTEENENDLTEIETVYNMFGIGAADSCPLECGAKQAYELEWFTPEDAIKEGAGWIGQDFIYNEFEQNTLYKMKWNPKMAEGNYWKQYATDIGWAEKQTEKIAQIYRQLDNPTYAYDIPVYKDYRVAESE